MIDHTAATSSPESDAADILADDRHFWCATAGVLLTICAVITLSSFEFVHASAFKVVDVKVYTDRPIAAVFALLVIGGFVYVLVALRSFQRAPPLRMVLIVGLLARLILLPGTPIQEDDIYRYMWDGRVSASGINPYRFSPEEVESADLSPSMFAADQAVDLANLKQLSTQDQPTEAVFARVNNRLYATIYPSISQAVFWLFGAVVPVSWDVQGQVIAMKLLLIFFDVGTLFALVALLRLAGKPEGLVVLYAWSPLVLKELANSGHMDSIPTFFLVCSLVFLLRRRGLSAGLLLGLAVGAKIYALLVLPLFLRFLGFRRGAAAFAGCAVVMGAASLAVGTGSDRYHETLFDFALGWEKNDAVFMWLQALWQWLPGADHALPVRVGALEADPTLATLLALATVLLILAGCAVWSVTRRVGSDPAEVLRRVFVLLVCLFLVGPLGFPWYFVWCMPFLAFARLRTWLFLPLLLSAYYMHFWLDYHHQAGFAGFARGVEFYDYLVVSVLFGAFFVALSVEYATRRLAGNPARNDNLTDASSPIP